MRNRHVPLSGKGYDEVFIIVKKNCDSEELYPLYLIFVKNEVLTKHF